MAGNEARGRASYVEAQSRGSSSGPAKLRSMLRTLSVDTTVVMPRRAASKPASVLFPVPLVPASSTVTLRRCSRTLRARAGCQRGQYGRGTPYTGRSPLCIRRHLSRQVWREPCAT